MTSSKLPTEVKPNKTDIMIESRDPIIETVFASLSKQPPGEKNTQKELELFAASTPDNRKDEHFCNQRIISFLFTVSLGVPEGRQRQQTFCDVRSAKMTATAILENLGWKCFMDCFFFSPTL